LGVVYKSFDALFASPFNIIQNIKKDLQSGGGGQRGAPIGNCPMSQKILVKGPIKCSSFKTKIKKLKN
jgi:hypothetical protein